MATTGTKGFKSILYYGDSDPASSAIAQIYELPDELTEEQDDLDITSSDSPVETATGAVWEESIPGGIIKTGEFSVDIVFKKSDTATLKGLRGKIKYFKIGIPDGTAGAIASYWKGQGYIKKFGQNFGRGDAVRTKMTFKRSGEWTFTAG